MTIADRGEAQPAPIPRAVVPADAAPEAMAGVFTQLNPGENAIAIEGAAWLQLKFADFQLGEDGTLTISAEDGQSQTFNQAQLESWEGLTAIFNGSSLNVTLTPGEAAPGVDDDISASIDEVIIGLPGSDLGSAESVAPEPIRDLLGDDFELYIPGDEPRQPEGSAIEAICGATDDRAASSHPFAGRIMPIGCTGWLIQGGALLTAGHCISASTQTVEFNVPSSQSNGATVSPPVRDQYRVITSSIVDAFTGIGNDWAVFQVEPNTETGLTPVAAQGGAFQVSNTAADPADVRITGFGVDGAAPGFGNPPPRNADNQTQQTHAGALTSHTVGGPSSATLRYATDTQGGNSGSPVLVEGGGNLTIGIHTNGGCSASGGSNAGTSFRNDGLWAAISNVSPSTSSATVEYGTDRPGSDIMQGFQLSADDHDLCRGACEADANCVAWTYVRRGHQGPTPRCWLKHSTPAPRDNACCVSGTK